MKFSRYYSNKGNFIYGFDPNIIKMDEGIKVERMKIENG